MSQGSGDMSCFHFVFRASWGSVVVCKLVMVYGCNSHA